MKKYIGLIIGLLPLIACLFGRQASAQLVMANNYYVVLNGGSAASPTTLVLTNPAPAGITNNGSGWIISENEFNQVNWDIGTSTGTYVVPFGYSTAQYLPLTLNINAGGVGAGKIKFATYHSPALNSAAQPSDVTNMNAFILPGSPSNADNSYNVADRFYIVDANTGYTTKPAAGNITFSYISGTANSEVATPNILTESRLMGQRFNSSTNTWSDWFGEGCTDAVVVNVGTVQTGPVPALDMYRSWSLWDQSMPIPLKMAFINVNCFGNGSATVTPYGGVMPYTYSWSAPGGSTATLSGLTAGTYTVSVSDNHACSSTLTATISQPGPVSVIATETSNVACNGGNSGSASSTASGGTSPYSYSWTPSGGTNATASGLAAGTYTLTAGDIYGCTATASAIITQPTALTASTTVTSNVTCNGGSNGGASPSATGGTSPYTYSWTGAGTNTSLSGLSAGTYTLNVTDNNACTATASAAITQPLALQDSVVSITNVNCHGNGSATITAYGGVAPYTYSWSAPGGTTATLSGLTAGTYTVSIMDNHGCPSSLTAAILQPAPISASINITSNVNCNGGNNGTASSTVNGGTSPYSYSWTVGGTNTTVSGLAAGTFTLTVSDIYGCTATASASITQPATALTASANVTSNVTCNGESNGSASVTASGGTGAYTYSWTSGGANATVSNLSAGTYTVTVTDANGCNGTASTVITAPSALSVAKHFQAASVGNCIGYAWVVASGGTSPYKYSWNNSGNSTTDTITGLCIGNSYCCTVTDKNGCQDSACVSILTGIDNISNASSIKIYPDPNNGNFTVEGVIRGQVIELYDYLGQNLTNVIADNTTMHFDISTKANGVYLVRIQNKDGSEVIQKKIVKTQ